MAKWVPLANNSGIRTSMPDLDQRLVEKATHRVFQEEFDSAPFPRPEMKSFEDDRLYP
jgi:hypothetical protein